MTIRTRTLLHAALLMGAGAGLSGCVYDLGLGFASDGYYDEYDDGYGCDPYGGYNAYYDCDFGQGFGNIGFGGGWYDNYYYPGYGIFLFDNGGRRYPMREQYRRYWGEMRHNWYRGHRGRDRVDGRYQWPGLGYNDGTTRGANGRTDSGAHAGSGKDQRAYGRRGRDGRGSDAVPMPNRDGLDRAYRSRDRGAGAQGAGGPDSRATPSDRALGSPPRENAAADLKSAELRSEPQRAPRQRDGASEGGVERPD